MTLKKKSANSGAMRGGNIVGKPSARKALGRPNRTALVLVKGYVLLRGLESVDLLRDLLRRNLLCSAEALSEKADAKLLDEPHDVFYIFRVPGGGRKPSKL